MTIRNNTIHVEINKGIYRTSGVTIAMGDKYAERFGARITQDGEALNLEGARVQGLFIRADYKTIILEGVTEGDTVYVDLSPECYAVMGSFALAIKIIVDERVTTIRMIDGNARATTTGNENTFPPVESPTLAELISRIEELEKEEEKPGGYYMPDISQPNDTTMRVSFTASNNAMPSVAPADLTLPQGPPGHTPIKGVDYFDGQPGSPGKDGVSPTIEVSKSGRTTTLAITDVNGTKTATIHDGLDGSGSGGSGDGGSGAPGGYYTPIVSQLDNATMRVSFEPSNSGMPSVLPVDVTLPQGPPGEPGFSPLIDVVKVGPVTTLYITDFNYPKSITIHDGMSGADGRTPVKGVDYWTAEDIAEIQNYVDSAILNGSW